MARPALVIFRICASLGLTVLLLWRGDRHHLAVPVSAGKWWL